MALALGVWVGPKLDRLLSGKQNRSLRKSEIAATENKYKVCEYYDCTVCRDD